MRTQTARVAALPGVILWALLFAAGARAQVAFTVNSTTDAVDSNPGDGVCASAGGQCTLRAALMEIGALASSSSLEAVS